MDGTRFDALTQRVAAGLSRRRSVEILAALGAQGLAGSGATDAKHKHEKK